MESVLIVAFDGFDEELIRKFGLKSIKQSEFGKIDNQTDIEKIKTSELFASFITGSTPKVHGIHGLGKAPNWKKAIENFLSKDLFQNRKGGNRIKKSIETMIDYEKSYYSREDLESETIFDIIDNSKAYFVPSYNPSVFWQKELFGLSFREYENEKRPLAYYWDEFEYERRKRNLFRPFNKWLDVSMIHFHRPDIYHHLYEEEIKDNNLGRIKRMYQETDSLAEEIIEFFEDDYEYIIFMSDHGLPTEKEHNANAFYSCNKELFGDEVPHITDFHDKILRKVQK